MFATPITPGLLYQVKAYGHFSMSVYASSSAEAIIKTIDMLGIPQAQ